MLKGPRHKSVEGPHLRRAKNAEVIRQAKGSACYTASAKSEVKQRECVIRLKGPQHNLIERGDTSVGSECRADPTGKEEVS